ncbi:M14 family zinc carboxypeptidase [Streptomyces sp. NPDC002870]|uniref:M14 family zinc carboxypeptidase n=1 Tax=Streptomyces sp. NPDC002870 TaxID=3364666 RepID=UPI00369B3E2A
MDYGYVPTQIDRFLTVDELNAAIEELVRDFPEQCRLRRVGSSRQGEPLTLLSVGHGQEQVLVVGGPHPNEPIGLLTVVHLAKLVAENEEARGRYTWNFIPCLDPDATRLNEGWFAGPYTIRHYHERFYRPALAEQPEWTFPVLEDGAYFDRMLPETQALARVVDELKPRLSYSLHNADFGGVFYILNRNLPGAAEALGKVSAKRGVELSLGPMDTLGWPEAGTAVYLMPEAKALAAAAARADGTAAFGSSSSHYAERHGATTLVAEAPLWRDPRANDISPSGRSYPAVLVEGARNAQETVEKLASIANPVKPHLTINTPLRRALDGSLEQTEGLAPAYQAMASVFAGRDATVAEEFTVRCTTHMMRLRAAGLIRRQLDAELRAGNQRTALRVASHEADALFDSWCAEAEAYLVAETYPLGDLVAVQVEAALAVARLLDAEAE